MVGIELFSCGIGWSTSFRCTRFREADDKPCNHIQNGRLRYRFDIQLLIIYFGAESEAALCEWLLRLLDERPKEKTGSSFTCFGGRPASNIPCLGRYGVFGVLKTPGVLPGVSDHHQRTLTMST